MKRKILLSIVISCLSGSLFAQQIPQHNTFMFNPMLINPAYAGSRDALSATIDARAQWVGLKGAPSTQGFTISSPLKNEHLRLGFGVQNDAIGPEQNFSIKGTFAYALPLAYGHIAFGLRGGIIQHSFDWSKITYKDPGDIVPSNAQKSVSVPTVDFGTYYYNRTFYAGLDFVQINKAHYNISSTNDSSKLSLQDVVHGHIIVGKAFELNQKIALKPSLVIRFVKNAPLSIDINLSMFYNKRLWVGLGLKTGYGPYILLEYYITNKFRIGYSYDMMTNIALGTAAGSHELFLGYDFNIFNKNIVSPRYF